MLLKLGPGHSDEFLNQLARDVDVCFFFLLSAMQFLKKLNIMDYSLLMGIHYIQKGPIVVDNQPENVVNTISSVVLPAIVAETRAAKPSLLPLPNISVLPLNGESSPNSLKILTPQFSFNHESDITMSKEPDFDDEKKLSMKQLSQRRQSNFGLKKNHGTITAANMPAILQAASVLNDSVEDAQASEIHSKSSLPLSPESGVAFSKDKRHSRAKSVLYIFCITFYSSRSVRSIFNMDSGGIASEEYDAIYFLGIIDILQLYNATKKAENFFKSFRFDAETISAVAPDFYASRMLNFLTKSMSHPPEPQ